MNKQSQVTTFIIVGIIMLFAIAVVVFVAKFSQNINVIDQEELERTPIEIYVGDCLEQIQKEALILLGQNGGYIEIPQTTLYNPYASAAYGNKREFAIPSWYVLGENKAPTLDSMENEISNYVEENLDFCLQDFGELSNQYNIEKLDSPSARTIINSGSVTTELTYPLQFTLKSNQSSQMYNKFTQNSNVDLYNIYNLGLEILQKESSDNFLEKITLNLMSTSDNIPFNGITFYQLKKSKSEAKDELKNLLEIAMPAIRLENTDYLPFSASEGKYDDFTKYDIEYFYKNRLNVPTATPPEDSYEYHNLFIQDWDSNYKQLTANFNYDSSMGMYFEGYPNSGDYLLSQAALPSSSNYLGGATSGTFDLSQITGVLLQNVLHYYHFVYDVYTPILVTISDENAFNGEGYRFNFILPIMISSNEPLKEGIPVTKRESVDLSLYDDEACFKESNTQITIRARDAYTGEALEDVNISYECFSTSCDLGQTSIQYGDIQLTEYLPNTCVGGMFKLQKEGYADTTVQKIPSYTHFTILMLPEKEFDLNIMKRPINNLESSVGLTKTETAIVTYKLLNATIFERNIDGENYYIAKPIIDYSQTVYYPTQDTKLNLINGKSKYYIETYLLDDGQMKGGYVGNWSTTYTDMSNKESLTINVLEFNEAIDIFNFEESLEEGSYEIMSYLYTNDTYINKIKPYFR